jgi:hypothetical protein
MALTIPCSTTNVISIDEYVDYVSAKVKVRDFDSVAASAPMLRALANDRALIVSQLNNRIENYLAEGVLPSAQALFLGGGQGFYVRAAIWPAINDMVSGRAYQDQFAYNLAHDHNFSFMTVNYLGPGYETELYEYDHDKVEGFVGESVDLRFVEKVRFGPGVAMLYRASRDVHVQYPPTELTITLNLMVADRDSLLRDQYFFDLTNRTIAGYPPELAATKRHSLLNLAGVLGNEDTGQLLRDLALTHPCKRTRLSAFYAWSKQQPAEAASIWERASIDKASLVANTARKRLQKLEQA